MTETQRIIIKLIQSGAQNGTIVSFTGKSGTYVKKLRKKYETDPTYFEEITAVRKIKEYLRKPKPAPKDTVKQRDCLYCGRRFESQWIGNRLCQRCNGDYRNVEPESASASYHFRAARRAN